MVYVSIDETDPKLGNGPGDHMYIADGDGRNRRVLHGPKGVRPGARRGVPRRRSREEPGPVCCSAPGTPTSSSGLQRVT